MTEFCCAYVYVGWRRGACATSVGQKVHSTTEHIKWLVQGGTGMYVCMAYSAFNCTFGEGSLSPQLWIHSIVAQCAPNKEYLAIVLA